MEMPASASEGPLTNGPKRFVPLITHRFTAESPPRAFQTDRLSKFPAVSVENSTRPLSTTGAWPDANLDVEVSVKSMSPTRTRLPCRHDLVFINLPFPLAPVKELPCGIRAD